jgi:hypothetical protein
MIADYVINALNARLDARIQHLSLREILEQEPGAFALASFSPRGIPGRFRSLLVLLGHELLGIAPGLLDLLVNLGDLPEQGWLARGQRKSQPDRRQQPLNAGKGRR